MAWQRARPPEAQRDRAGRADLARALYTAGDLRAAEPLARGLVAERSTDREALTLLALIAARSGRRAEAARLAERLRLARGPYDRGRTDYARAQIAAGLGDREAALALLHQALAEGVPFGPALHADAEFAPLRDDPRFRNLLRPKG